MLEKIVFRSCFSPLYVFSFLVSHKTPTCVLLGPDKKFKSFGYQAEDDYNQIASDDNKNHYDYYYFRRFKMILHSRAVCLLPHLLHNHAIYIPVVLC